MVIARSGYGNGFLQQISWQRPTGASLLDPIADRLLGEDGLKSVRRGPV
jgi:hypothetical protein